MASDAERLKTITDNIERLYQAMRRAAGNIAGLLQLGQATCEEVRAYNLWALATYNTQRGMLATLRAHGEPNVPELPPSPTLFTWKGVSGEAAWQIDCGSGQSLAGALRAAMKPAKAARKLSANEIQISTQDPYAFEPERAPSFATLLQVQAARTQAGVSGLGAFPLVLIAIAGIAIAVSVALAAIMKYLETSEVQESNSKQVALQADAFANYTAARLECLKTCTGQGGSTEKCVATCNKLVDKPQITLPGQGKPWGWLQWTGFTVVAGVGAMIVWRAIQRRREGRPIFELPPLSGMGVGMPKDTDSLRRDDMRRDIPKPRKARKPRRMWAVVSEGRDHGAYRTPEEAQAVADTLPDGYISEVMRSP